MVDGDGRAFGRFPYPVCDLLRSVQCMQARVFLGRACKERKAPGLANSPTSQSSRSRHSSAKSGRNGRRPQRSKKRRRHPKKTATVRAPCRGGLDESRKISHLWRVRLARLGGMQSRIMAGEHEAVGWGGVRGCIWGYWLWLGRRRDPRAGLANSRGLVRFVCGEAAPVASVGKSSR